MKRDWYYKDGMYRRDPPLWPWFVLAAISIGLSIGLHFL